MQLSLVGRGEDPGGTDRCDVMLVGASAVAVVFCRVNLSGHVPVGVGPSKGDPVQRITACLCGF